jgi:hypothetical protein
MSNTVPVSKTLLGVQELSEREWPVRQMNSPGRCQYRMFVGVENVALVPSNAVQTEAQRKQEYYAERDRNSKVN